MLEEDKGGGSGGEGGGTPKTFTQEEVNKMMANEKRQGRLSVLKDLGIETDDDASVTGAKESLKKYKETENANKTEVEKAKGDLTTEQQAHAATKQKADLLQNKLDAIGQGIKADYVDDALAIALPKVSKDKDLKTVLGEMKERYPMFYTETDPNDKGNKTGTGTLPGGKKPNPNDKSLGVRLGEKAKKNAGKSSYFSK
jgi:hypothetical protein